MRFPPIDKLALGVEPLDAGNPADDAKARRRAHWFTVAMMAPGALLLILGLWLFIDSSGVGPGRPGRLW